MTPIFAALLRRGVLASLLLLLPLASTILAQESITGFDSWIQVEPGGTITVVETITVVATGQQIKRGIYRDFPTDYKTPSGKHLRVDFNLLSVQKDGKQEPYHTKQLGNGIRIYIGSEDVFLRPGTYTYTLTYQTDRQIGFFPTYDELYWNVTGNGWEFPIERATATVVLPGEASVLQYSAYTGPQGSTVSNAEVTTQTGNEISFRTTAPLHRREGLTIAVAWPKGFVHEPDLQDKASYLLRDNLTLVVSGIGLLFLLAYYLVIWFKVGRDPEPEAIIPRFDPPRDFTPAAARYVMQMGFDDKTFTSGVVSMAVKKFLIIDNESDTFSLERVPEADPKTLSRGERKVADKLFSGSDRIQLKQSNHTTIGGALRALESSLSDDFEAMHFKRNSIYLVPGLVITLLIILSIFLSAHDRATAGFMSIWLTMWTIGCYALIYRSYTAVRLAAASGSGLGAKIAAIFSILFALPFLGGWFFGFYAMSTATSMSSVFALIVILGVNILFYYLLKAPTLLGRRIMDQLEGLKLYLSVAEKDRLNMLNPPDKTPELFERFLPWALALDVEQQWCDQFNDILEQAGRDREYAPGWYRGPGRFSTAGLATSLGSSLSGSIASSSTAPGSSSGSGGGGSSGGGGGGGGGGGW